MTPEDAVRWVKKWRTKHPQKNLNTKDKALIALARDVEKVLIILHGEGAGGDKK